MPVLQHFKHKSRVIIRAGMIMTNKRDKIETLKSESPYRYASLVCARHFNCSLTKR